MYQQWNLADLPLIPKNGYNVFSTFACGGGSSMGYKLSGYNIVGVNEIDPEMAGIYKVNFNPPYLFNEDIRQFVARQEYPPELNNLDILDGSPPCSVFSVAGKREEGWGKQKVFREGQAKQTLDDLFFVFIELARKLQPKIVVSENVRGMLLGNAKGYVKMIFDGFDKAGYDTQLFLLNAATMGVPQRRERVFFISRRKDLNLKPITFNFNEEPITYEQIKTTDGLIGEMSPANLELMKYKSYNDGSIADINMRVYGKNSNFNAALIKDNKVPNTLVSSNVFISYTDERLCSTKEMIRIQSFPEDYNFGARGYNAIKYILGMSVPPYMMNRVSKQIQLQWLDTLPKHS